MDKTFLVECPFCLEENKLNFMDYQHYQGEFHYLKDRCAQCGNVYAFELEVELSATSYNEGNDYE